MRGDDFGRQYHQLGDNRDFHADDEAGGRLEGEGDDLRRLTGIVEVARTAAELVPCLAEALDRVAGVLAEHVGRRRDAPRLVPLHLCGERAPHLGALDQLVLVGGGPLEAEHLEDPLKRIRQHHGQGGIPP
ncbi:hypothetical protein PQR15_24660 [Streptomyces lydicus]|nr:hypothetical protein [Streptomyces lydicus]